MNVLSLFDGVSCGRQALTNLGIKVDKYYASEIEKQPIKVTQYKFPDTIQLGDVRNVKGSELGHIDLIMFGSPCQGFSRAGKMLNFDDPRSKLFFEAVRILNELRVINPDIKFLMENVDMGKNELGIISEYLGVFPVKINSSLLSAQSRQRWYWTNIRTRKEGFFDEIHTDIPQPKDRGILLKDILQPESEVSEKYYMSEKTLSRLNVSNVGYVGYVGYNKEGKDSDKSASLLARDYKGMSNQGINVVKVEGKSKTVRASSAGSTDRHNWDVIKVSKDGSVKNDQEKSSTVTGGGHSGGNHSDMDLLIVAQRGRGEYNQQSLEINESGKSNALTSVQKDNMLFCKNYAQWDVSGKGYKSQQDRAFYEEGKSGTLGSHSSANKTNVLIVNEATKKGNIEVKPGECFDFENPSSSTRRGRRMDTKSNTVMAKETDFMQYTPSFRIRRLTVKEVCRLQTINDDYFFDKDGNNLISDSAIYKAVGNAWTVKVIEHILSFL